MMKLVWCTLGVLCYTHSLQATTYSYPIYTLRKRVQINWPRVMALSIFEVVKLKRSIIIIIAG